MRQAVKSSCLGSALSGRRYVQYRVRFNPLTATGTRNANLDLRTTPRPDPSFPFAPAGQRELRSERSRALGRRTHDTAEVFEPQSKTQPSPRIARRGLSAWIARRSGNARPGRAVSEFQAGVNPY